MPAPHDPDIIDVPVREPSREAGPAHPLPPRVPSLAFLLAHPAHFMALGFGSGLSPWAPGTVGTLWGWVAYLVLTPWVQGLPGGWAAMLVAGLGVGWWACTVAARHAGIADPGFIVWDEILAFWLVLWLLMPASGWWQLVAFGLFRYFDAAKPGPVRWADQRFKGGGWRGGFGILFDDLVAAACTLVVLALLFKLWPGGIA
ncbi:MAG: phosphatidylglycerophosphatase A [Burkholderiales bacterium]